MVSNEDTEFEVTSNLDKVEQGLGHGDKTSLSPPEPLGLERYINLASVVHFGVIVVASWESFATTFQFALNNGGPSSMFYGSILAGFGCCAVGFSLAELASIDPTVGAQYRWSANLAPAGMGRFCGLLQGWITVAAWCFACGGPPSILANIITSIAIFNYDNYESKKWHSSLVMIAVIIAPSVFNLWFRKVLYSFEMIAEALHIVLFIVFIVVLIVFGSRNSPDFVFGTLLWENSGWNNKGISWGLGLLTITFSVTGFDSVLHMSDEVKKVRTRVPQSIIIACTVNSAMLFAFAIVLLFFFGPLDQDLLESPLPLILVIYRATGSKAATNVMISLVAAVIFFALFNCFASVSRLVWAFARDNGLPFSKFFAYVHPTLKLPVNALFLLSVVVTGISLIYIASDTAFDALISLQAFGLHVSYVFPILFILLRKLRGPPPPYGPYKLGAAGIPINIFALCYLIYVVIWMPLPNKLPVTKNNMNYAGPIFGFVIIGALGHWFIRARKTFKMPLTRYE